MVPSGHSRSGCVRACPALPPAATPRHRHRRGPAATGRRRAVHRLRCRHRQHWAPPAPAVARLCVPAAAMPARAAWRGCWRTARWRCPPPDHPVPGSRPPPALAAATGRAAVPALPAAMRCATAAPGSCGRHALQWRRAVHHAKRHPCMSLPHERKSRPDYPGRPPLPHTSSHAAVNGPWPRAAARPARVAAKAHAWPALQRWSPAGSVPSGSCPPQYGSRERCR